MKKPRHIIIDGSDGLGKTTILEKVSLILNFPIIKMPNMKQYIEENNAEQFSMLFNQTVIQFAQYPFLLDRGYTSSLVYSKLFGRKFDLGYLKDTEEILKPLVIIFTGEYTDPCGKTDYISFRGDDLFSSKEQKRIDREFCRLSRLREYPLVHVCNKTLLQVTEEVLRIIHDYR